MWLYAYSLVNVAAEIIRDALICSHDGAGKCISRNQDPLRQRTTKSASVPSPFPFSLAVHTGLQRLYEDKDSAKTKNDLPQAGNTPSAPAAYCGSPTVHMAAGHVDGEQWLF